MSDRLFDDAAPGSVWEASDGTRWEYVSGSDKTLVTFPHVLRRISDGVEDSFTDVGFDAVTPEYRRHSIVKRAFDLHAMLMSS